MNVITAAAPEIIRIPIHYKTDREVLDMAYATIPDFNPDHPRIVRIKNTLELEEMLISEVMVTEAEALDHIQFIDKPKPVEFNLDGNLI